MAATETGLWIAELKTRSGLSWDALARQLGASSGDYVRKVASGARPGNNLSGAVAELRSAGRVQSVVARRRTKSGELAKVRASRSTGAPSRRPEQQELDPTRGYMAAGPAGSLSWSGEYAIEDVDGIMRALRAARRARKRVSFRLHYVDENGYDHWVQAGSKAGYDPRRVMAEIGNAPTTLEVEDWLLSQSKRHYLEKKGLRMYLVGVEIYAT